MTDNQSASQVENTSNRALTVSVFTDTDRYVLDGVAQGSPELPLPGGES